MALPDRSLDTLSEAIAISSPNGHMSKRSRNAALKRLGAALFGDYVPVSKVPNDAERAQHLRNQAADLRRMADGGMRPRAFRKQAELYELQAAFIQAPYDHPFEPDMRGLCKVCGTDHR